MQLELYMKPSVNFDTETDTEDRYTQHNPVGIAIDNSGPAPTRIKSITYYVDRKPVRDISEAIEYGKFDPHKVAYLSLRMTIQLRWGKVLACTVLKKERR